MKIFLINFDFYEKIVGFFLIMSDNSRYKIEWPEKFRLFTQSVAQLKYS